MALHTVKVETEKEGALIAQFTDRCLAVEYAIAANKEPGVTAVHGPDFGTVIHKSVDDALSTLRSWIG